MDEMLKKLYSTDKAMAWTEEFCKIFREIYHTDIDEDWVFWWFANAMQTSAQIREEKIVKTWTKADFEKAKGQYKSRGLL